MFSFFTKSSEGTNTLTKNTCNQLIRNLIKKDLKKRENLIALSSTNMPKKILENLAENFENVTMTEGLVRRQRDRCFSYFDKYMKPKLVKIFEEERQKLFASNTRNKTKNNRNNRKREKKTRVRFNPKINIHTINSTTNTDFYNSGISNNNFGISNNNNYNNSINSINNKPVNNNAAREERREAAKARHSAWEKSYAEKHNQNSTKGGKRSKLTKRQRKNLCKKSAKTRKLRK